MYIQQHQAVTSALKEFKLRIAHLSATDACSNLKLMGRSADQPLFRDTQLGSGSGPAGVVWILLEEKKKADKDLEYLLWWRCGPFL